MSQDCTCGCPPCSPFRYREWTRPSIFVRDHHGVWNGNGRDPSTTASETKARIEAESGCNLAEIGQLSHRTSWATVKAP